jgi:hypothetical protein
MITFARSTRVAQRVLVAIERDPDERIGASLSYRNPTRKTSHRNAPPG